MGDKGENFEDFAGVRDPEAKTRISKVNKPMVECKLVISIYTQLTRMLSNKLLHFECIIQNDNFPS